MTFNNISGTFDSDTLIGTDGDDRFLTGDNNGSGDFVAPGLGNDQIDFSDVAVGYVQVNYSFLDGLGQSIAVSIDGAANTGSVVYSGGDTDTFVDVENPLITGWTTGGLEIIGTAGNDSFSAAPGNEQWMSLRMGDGVDTVEINGAGVVRLDFQTGTEAIDIDLSTRSIANDGFGNVETIGGTSPLWEVVGTFFDDSFVGADVRDSFRVQGGNDDLDGGAGFDRLRFDGWQISSVNIDTATGIAQGALNSGSFTTQFANFEIFRGSGGDDTISGSSADEQFEGLGGIDTFVYTGGNDTIGDFDFSNETITFDLGTPQMVRNALDAASVNGAGGVVVNFGNGNSLTFNAATQAQVQSLPASGSGNEITGTVADEQLIGTADDDNIITGGGLDNVEGSAGNDTIRMGENGVPDGAVLLSYSQLSGGIDAVIDGVANTGSVDKGAAGIDTLVGVAAPMISGWESFGGFVITGTNQNDSFVVTLEDQWTEVVGGDGVDSYTINGGGIVRMTLDGGPQNAVVNLGTGQVLNDGFGNAETITGRVRELQGGEGNDTLIGSAENDSFISRGGDDSIDGGEGFDRIRYDRGGVDGGVDVDLEAGTATGSWFGQAFTDTLTSIENVRSSTSDDTIRGSSADERFDGRGGSDSFAYTGGNDTIGDFDAANDTLTVQNGATQAEVDAALAAASNNGAGQAVVDFGGGDSLTFNWLSVADIQSLIGNAGGTEPVPGMEVSGTGGSDVLNGDAGDDTINAGSGNDTVFGGAGNDDITAGLGFDTLNGGNGNDVIRGLDGFDTISGNDGNDTLYGNAGNDLLYGGNGDDVLEAGIGADELHGDADNDSLTGLDGFDTLFGGSGNDTLQGNAGNDLLNGGDGDDLLDGGIGFDAMNGDAGNDTLIGLEGFDTLNGGEGDDSLLGNAGNDELYGGAGADRLEGGIGFDTLQGDDGNDLIFGGKGYDVMTGGDGDDRLSGNAGNDMLDAGAGSDVLIGGLGADTFVFGIGYGEDRVADFQNNIDSIHLDADLLGGGNPEPLDLIQYAGRTADDFLILDFGGGETLTFTGVTNTGAILGDVVFV